MSAGHPPRESAPWHDYPALAAAGKIVRRGRAGAFGVVLVSGDAYVDHPAFPAGLLPTPLLPGACSPSPCRAA